MYEVSKREAIHLITGRRTLLAMFDYNQYKTVLFRKRISDLQNGTCQYTSQT